MNCQSCGKKRVKSAMCFVCAKKNQAELRKLLKSGMDEIMNFSLIFMRREPVHIVKCCGDPCLCKVLGEERE